MHVGPIIYRPGGSACFFKKLYFLLVLDDQRNCDLLTFDFFIEPIFYTNVKMNFFKKSFFKEHFFLEKTLNYTFSKIRLIIVA